MFIIILFWLGCDRPSGLLFFRARLAFFHIQASLLTSFVCFFILFHSCCSHTHMFGKTLVHEFPISYSHTEWYLPFFALWRQWIIGNGALLNKSYYYLGGNDPSSRQPRVISYSIRTFLPRPPFIFSTSTLLYLASHAFFSFLSFLLLQCASVRDSTLTSVPHFL